MSSSAAMTRLVLSAALIGLLALASGADLSERSGAAHRAGSSRRRHRHDGADRRSGFVRGLGSVRPCR
jgi:hypothetical protein